MEEKKELAIGIALISGGIASLLMEADQIVLIWFTPPTLNFLVIRKFAVISSLLLYLSLFLFSFIYALKGRKTNLLYKLGLILIFNLIIRNICTTFIPRDRPPTLHLGGAVSDLISILKEKNSFPSGHAMNSTAISAMWHNNIVNSWLVYLLWFCTFLICLSRLLLAHHWLSDVLVGGGIGFFTEVGAKKILKKIKS
ncbi:MAG: phosphatase PAP2 family protein [Euryarchaeota archaeon]|nr:phosphatase PAP2 family protein [Euryarchaeota archaeon]